MCVYRILLKITYLLTLQTNFPKEKSMEAGQGDKQTIKQNNGHLNASKITDLHISLIRCWNLEVDNQSPVDVNNGTVKLLP